MTSVPSPSSTDPNLETLLARVTSLLANEGGATEVPQRRANDTQHTAPALARGDELGGRRVFTTTAAAPSAAPPPSNLKFVPPAPRSLAEIGVPTSEIEAIVLKTLLYRGTLSGHEVAKHVALPFPLIEPLLQALKASRLVVLKSAASLGDYIYELTESGLKNAHQHAARCAYGGTVPVALPEYVASVAAQSLQNTRPQLEDLRRALSGLSIGEAMFLRLARAVSSGKGLFLYGRPGNGKTTIAERVTRAYGSSVWIPRAIDASGEIIRLFDPSCHEELPMAKETGLLEIEQIDQRWVRIRRPTIVVGGELTLDSLELTVNSATNVCEASLQMKSNCGTLVIDDFGRQQIPPAALLNRWIVPLEKRHDYLDLPSGRKIQVPFDQFVVFATNLEPRDLVDEAFLRRIPYKIDVLNPDESQFRELFVKAAQAAGVAFDDDVYEYLLAKYFKSVGREFRFCQPRDLVQQVSVYCSVLNLRPTLSIAAIDAAAQDYFAML